MRCAFFQEPLKFRFARVLVGQSRVALGHTRKVRTPQSAVGANDSPL